MKRFVVGPDDLGTPEALWQDSGHLVGLAPLDLPAAGLRGLVEVVVLAPHPDDEVLGVGGLLRRLGLAGAVIRVVAVTDGEGSYGPLDAASAAALGKKRRRESRSGLDRLGLGAATVDHLGMPDGGVTGCVDELTGEVAARLAGAHWCVAPWSGDGHPDHEAVGAAAAAACRRTGVPLVEYPIWAWHWARPHSDDLPWQRARALALLPTDRRAKQAAIGEHRSQIEAPPGRQGDTPVLPPQVLAHFDRDVEVLFV